MRNHTCPGNVCQDKCNHANSRKQRLALETAIFSSVPRLAWTLLAAASSPLRDRLAFQGDTALYHCYL